MKRVSTELQNGLLDNYSNKFKKYLSYWEGNANSNEVLNLEVNGAKLSFFLDNDIIIMAARIDGKRISNAVFMELEVLGNHFGYLNTHTSVLSKDSINNNFLEDSINADYEELDDMYLAS